MIPFYGKVFNKAIETERNNTQPAFDRFALKVNGWNWFYHYPSLEMVTPYMSETRQKATHNQSINKAQLSVLTCKYLDSLSVS